MNNSVARNLKIIIQTEGFFVLLISILVYAKLGATWGTFILLFFAPDLSLLGYLAGSRIGAFFYNIAHSYIGPIVTLTLGISSEISVAISAGLIWTAHIGFDRMLGYGLKYSTGFRFTHLGTIGRSKKPS